MDKATFLIDILEAFPNHTFTFKTDGCFMATCGNLSAFWHTDEGYSLMVPNGNSFIGGTGDTVTETLAELETKLPNNQLSL